MDDLTVAERAAVNSRLADVLKLWDKARDVDCLTLCQAMTATTAIMLRGLRDRKNDVA